MIGIGALGLSPKEFWNMGFPELYLAIEGYMEANTVQEEKRFGKDELHEMMERYPD